MARPTRILIIAAGMGSRLESYTRECPKCMVKVQDRSILDYQREALEAHGVTDLHVVRGYLADKLVVPGATYYHNSDFQVNNILHSAMCGLPAFEAPEGLLVSYSDIVYSAGVVKTLLETPGDIVLTVDTQWAKAYEGRSDHPVEQAELVILENPDSVSSKGCEDNGGVPRVAQVGKWVGPKGAFGEFIGLVKLSAKGAKAVQELWKGLQEDVLLDAPWRHAEHFRRAYLADLFEALIEQGFPIHIAAIKGNWREIDTVQDLRRAHEELFGS